MDAEIIVIGYGNPLRGDDGVAEVILQGLRELVPVSKKVGLLNRHQLDIADADIISRAQAVIFVDAHVGDDFRDIRLERINLPQKVSPHVSHVASPEELLCLTRDIYGVAPPAYICTVRGHNFTLGASLSKPTLDLSDRAVEEIVKLIELI